MPPIDAPSRFTNSTPPPTGVAVEALVERVEKVARRAAWWLRLRAAMWFLTTVLLVFVVAMGIDWVWRTPPVGVRFCLTGSVVVAILMAIWRWGRPAWLLEASVSQTARRIEYRYPQLGDRLSSLVALKDPAANPHRSGLVAVAAEETERQARSLDFAQALDTRRLRHASAALIVVLAAIMGAAWWLPAVVSRGMARLAAPWNELPWPRNDYLQLTIEDMVLAGQTVTVAVDNFAQPSRALPNDLRIHWRSTADPGQQRSLPVDHASGKATLGADNTQTTFEVRASGGDDDTMGWQRVEVVPQPRLTQASFRVHPPTASGGSPFEETGEQFSIPQGSLLQFVAQSDRAIQTAQLQIGLATENIKLQVGANGRRITTEWRPDPDLDTLQLAVQWKDANGLSGTFSRRWRVEVIPDTPPDVRWAMDSDEFRVTNDAVLDLNFTARDNYRLVASGLQWDQSSTESAASPTDAVAWPYYQSDDAALVTRNIRLPVKELPAVESSTSWALHAAAQDSAGQVGRSLPLRIYLLTPQELLTELTKDSQQVLEQVRAAVRSQQIAAERTREAGLQANPQRRQDSLHIADAAQQQALQQIDGPTQAALPLATRIAQRAETNRAQSAFLDTVRQATDQLTELREQTLRPAAQQLEAAATENPTAVDRPGLADLAARQNAAADQLQQIAEQLAAGLQSQLVAESIRDAAAQQQRLAAASDRAGADAASELTEALADQQRDVARQTERLQDQLMDMAETAGSSEAERQRLSAAADRLGQQRIADRMRTAANDLAQRQPGAAAEAQQAIARDMRRIASDFASAAGESVAGSRGRLADQAAQLAVQQRAVSQRIAETLRRQGVDSETAIAQQSDTLDAVQTLRPELESMPLFPESLDQAQRRMEATLARLRRSPTDPQSLEDARKASEMLEEIANAIEQASQDQARGAASNADNADRTAADASAENQSSPPIASLHLMRSLQTRLQAETAQLDEQAIASADDEAIANLTRQRQQLSVQQAELAERLQSFLNTAKESSKASQEADLSNPPENKEEESRE